MKILIKNVPGLKLPEAAHPGEDAAYDITATTPPIIVGDSIERPMDGLKLWKRVVFIEYGTNMFIAPDTEDRIEWICKEGTGGTVDWKYVGVQYHTQLYPRSSISKQNLMLANCVPVIDTGYRGQVLLRFKYMFQPEDLFVIQEDIIRIYGIVRNEYIYQQNDKIVQIMAFPNIPIIFEKVTELPESNRAAGGFDSSGR